MDDGRMKGWTSFYEEPAELHVFLLLFVPQLLKSLQSLDDREASAPLNFKFQTNL